MFILGLNLNQMTIVLRMLISMMLMLMMMMMTNEEAGTYICSGPPCKEAPAHCSRVVHSRKVQGGLHTSITPICSLVGIGAPAQQQERRVPDLEPAGDVQWCHLGRSFGGTPASPLTIHNPKNMWR